MKKKYIIARISHSTDRLGIYDGEYDTVEEAEKEILALLTGRYQVDRLGTYTILPIYHN